MMPHEEMDAAKAVRDAFRWPMRITVIAACLLIALATWVLQGCSTISVSTPEGYQAHYTRIGNQDISGLRFEKSENGLYRLTLDKQSSDSDVLNVIRQLVAQ